MSAPEVSAADLEAWRNTLPDDCAAARLADWLLLPDDPEAGQ